MCVIAKIRWKNGLFGRKTMDMTEQQPSTAPTVETLPQGTVVMQILPNLISGGVEQGTVDLNAGLTKAGMKSIVVSNGGPRVYEITRAGGVHIELPVHAKNPLTMWLTSRKLRKLIIEHKVDVVHAASRAPAWVARRAVEGTNAAFVTSCHAAHKIGNRFKRAYNAAITAGSRVMAVSHYLADYLRTHYGVDDAKMSVIYRGLSLERYHPTVVSAERLIAVARHMRVPDGAAVIMLPGRLTRGKGHIVLLKALAKIKNRDALCLFVGSDAGQHNYRAELEREIARLGLESQCRIVTDCPDLPAAYMLATVVACPSLVPEGFGRIAIEAQAMGRPVIAARNGGLSETLVDGKTGWLVPPNDADALAVALDAALTLSGEERSALATRAMNHVATYFTNALMCEKTFAVYAQALADKKAELAKPVLPRTARKVA